MKFDNDIYVVTKTIYHVDGFTKGTEWDTQTWHMESDAYVFPTYDGARVFLVANVMEEHPWTDPEELDTQLDYHGAWEDDNDFMIITHWSIQTGD